MEVYFCKRPGRLDRWHGLALAWHGSVAGSITNVDANMDFDTEVDWYNRVEYAEDIEVSYG
jgi:hypothetical protein